MVYQVGVNAAAAFSGGYAASQDDANEAEFKRILQEVDDQLDSPEERARKRAAEARAHAALVERRKRLNELYARLTQLRSKLSAKGGKDSKLEAEISAVMTELFWLKFQF